MTLLRPFLNRLRQLAGQTHDFWSLADDIWHPSPAETLEFPPAIFLPGQLDRITATAFATAEETVHAVKEAGPRPVGPTIAARFRDVDLVDGVLYKGHSEYHLRPRHRRMPVAARPAQSTSGAIYDSWLGLRYFGSWLMDDTETYRLAEEVGNPVTLRTNNPGHYGEYESRLSMAPQRIGAGIHFDELVLFKDMANNTGKMARAADRRTRLLAKRTVTPHPGIFLLRGTAGDARILENELAIADHLARRHGIRTMNPLDHSVEDLLQACAGAQLIVGVEGSQLTHALTIMPPGGSLLAICPPDRVTASLKLMTDRLAVNFAFVIGTGTVNGFSVATDEVEATVQMLP